jgi:hypothetical protein
MLDGKGHILISVVSNAGLSASRRSRENNKIPDVNFRQTGYIMIPDGSGNDFQSLSQSGKKCCSFNTCMKFLHGFRYRR